MRECLGERNLAEIDEVFLEGKMEMKDEEWNLVRNKVKEEYIKNDLPEKTIELFNGHNKHVEDFVRKFSEEEKFNERETEIALLAAIMHDIAKGSGEFEMHGEVGGERAENILLEMGKSEKLARSVNLAIMRHMGQEGWPAMKAKEKYGPDFEFPKYATRVGQMVYECDILTQLTKEGFNKIVHLRGMDKKLRKEDEEEALRRGVTREWAAAESALKSAQTSLGLIKTKSVHDFAERLFKEIKGDYSEHFKERG